jgi:hypothetical protein
MSDCTYIGLTVTGPTAEIARFREAIRGRGEYSDEITIDFSGVVGIPQEITEIWEDRDGVFWVPLDTAGDVPYTLIGKMVALFPQLVFGGSAPENASEDDSEAPETEAASS